MASSSGSGHLVEEFDSAFQNCLSAIMKQEHFNVNDSEETKNSVEQCVQKFADIAKQLESFFLQKRLMLSIHKPEQILKEDINELRQELQRKEMLLNKHHDKLHHWQNILSRQQSQQQQQQAQGQQQQQPQQQSTPQSQAQGQPQTVPPPQMLGAQAQGQSQGALAGALSSTQQQPSPAIHQGGTPPRAMAHPQQAMAQGQPQLQQQHSQPGVPNQQSPGLAMGSMSGGGATMGGMTHPPQLQHQGSFPQGPLAFLEQTTSNIGMPERR